MKLTEIRKTIKQDNRVAIPGTYAKLIDSNLNKMRKLMTKSIRLRNHGLKRDNLYSQIRWIQPMKDVKYRDFPVNVVFREETSRSSIIVEFNRKESIHGGVFMKWIFNMSKTNPWEIEFDERKAGIK